MKTSSNQTTSHKSLIIALATLFCTVICLNVLADDGPNKRRKYRSSKARMYNKMLTANLSTSFLNSASGHKSGYSANFGLGNSRNLFEAGAILNQETNKLSGAHLRYKRFFMPSYKVSSIYVQASAIYRNNSPLKQDLNEIMHTDDYAGNFETFNTVELYAGLGFQQRFFNSIFTDVSVGVGGYSRSLSSDFDNRNKNFIRYSDDKGLGLSIKLTVGYYLW